MGLDTVELVMAFEEEFGIEIPNEAAEKMVSVRDVRDFILTAIQRRGGIAEPENVFEQIRAITARIANIDRSAIQLDTELVDDLGLD